MMGQFPRRMWRYPAGNSLVEQLGKLSPRQRWIAEQSMRRYERRIDCAATVLLGELGQWDGIQFVEKAPPPP